MQQKKTHIKPADTLSASGVVHFLTPTSYLFVDSKEAK